MNPQSIKWDWNPLVSIGIIKFGEPIEPLISTLNLNKTVSEVPERESYQISSYYTSIDTENSLVVAVFCFENIYYKDRNLLGLNLDQIRCLLGKETRISDPLVYEIEGITFEKIPVEFDDLSLELWLDKGLVERAIVYGMIEEDE
jgi:hypothetical protein